MGVEKRVQAGAQKMQQAQTWSCVKAFRQRGNLLVIMMPLTEAPYN